MGKSRLPAPASAAEGEVVDFVLCSLPGEVKARRRAPKGGTP